MAVTEAFNTKQQPKISYPDINPVVDMDLILCPAENRPRMIAIANLLAKSPLGMETLQNAVELGYRFAFMNDDRKANGSTSFSAKRILLNPHMSDDKLVGTLCHECRHAVQKSRSAALDEEERWDIRSNLLYNRAMEADAQTYAICACKELALQGTDKPYAEFKEKYPEIEKAFDTAYRAAGNKITHKVMTKAFEGWYDQEVMKTRYEQGYILKPLAGDLKWMQRGLCGKSFDRSVSVWQTIKELTQTKDGNYFTDNPEVLNGGKYMSVTENTMQQMKNYMEARKMLNKGDKSFVLEGIPTRLDVFISDMVEIKKPEPKNTDVQAALMRKIMLKRGR